MYIGREAFRSSALEEAEKRMDHGEYKRTLEDNRLLGFLALLHRKTATRHFR